MNANDPSQFGLELFNCRRKHALGCVVVLLQVFGPFLDSHLAIDLALLQFAAGILNGLDPEVCKGLVQVRFVLVVGGVIPIWQTMAELCGDMKERE